MGPHGEEILNSNGHKKLFLIQQMTDNQPMFFK